MKILLFLTFLLFASPSYTGSWDTPSKVAEGAYSKSIYIDPKTPMQHIVWCQQIAGTNDIFVFYKQMTMSGQQTNGQQLEGVHGCKEVAIDGQEDGKTIIVVFSGARMSGEAECTEKNPDGCIDMFYKQSKDGGVTWSLSIPVPRNDMKDVVHRLNPQLMQIKETGRTWILYMKNDTSQDYASLRYVCRAPGSDLFDKELQLLPGEKRYPVATYTNNGKIQILHVVWIELVEKNYIGYYSRSLDNGKTWTQPAAIMKRTKTEREIPRMNIFSGRTAPGFVFMVFPDMQYTKWLIQWSHDNGATWSSDTVALNYYKYLSASVCAVTVLHLETELFMVSENDDQGEFGAFSVNKASYYKGETPFVRTDNKTGPIIACMPDGKKKQIIVKALVTGGETGKALYHTTQDYAPITMAKEEEN